MPLVWPAVAFELDDRIFTNTPRCKPTKLTDSLRPRNRPHQLRQDRRYNGGTTKGIVSRMRLVENVPQVASIRGGIVKAERITDDTRPLEITTRIAL